MNVMPMELPTKKVAGSPTRMSSPAELLTIAISTSGATKSTFNAEATRMIMGANRPPWSH